MTKYDANVYSLQYETEWSVYDISFGYGKKQRASLRLQTILMELTIEASLAGE